MNELIVLLNTTLRKPPKKFKREQGSKLDSAAAVVPQNLNLNVTYVVKSSAKNVEMLPEPEYEVALSAADPGSDIFGIEEPEHPPFGKHNTSLNMILFAFIYFKKDSCENRLEH